MPFTTSPPGKLLTVTKSLTTAQVRTLNSSPATLVAAVPGFVIVPVSCVAECVFGTAAYQTGDGLSLAYTDDTLPLLNLGGTGLTNNTSNRFFVGPFASTPSVSGTSFKNLPLVVTSGSDPGSWGGIGAATLNAGGLLYSANDTGTISAGNFDATYKVLTVGGGGNVLTFQITAPGTMYQVANGVGTSPTSGAGDGNFTINITGLTAIGDGTLIVSMGYYLLPSN